jgi:ribose transport system permease protein
MVNNGFFQNTINKIRDNNVLSIYLTGVFLYIISGILQPNYFSLASIFQLLALASFLGIIAMGQTLVILTGGLDLSVAYCLNIGAVVMTRTAAQCGASFAVLLVFLIALLIGLINGIGIAVLNISPLIMTLAMNSILNSAVLVYTGGTPKGIVPQVVSFLGGGQLFLNADRTLGIRIVILVWTVLSVVVIFMLKKTSYARKIYAVGTNRRAAWLSGINVNFIIISVYCLSSVFAVLAGLLLTGSSGLSYIGMGNYYQMLSIAAVVIGTTSINGGKGGYVGTIAGVLITFIITRLLTALHWTDSIRQIINGGIILMMLLLYGREKRIRV